MSCDHTPLREAIAAGRWVSYADEHLPAPRACISCEAMWGEGARACPHCTSLLLPYRRRRVWAWCPEGHWVRTKELLATAEAAAT